MRRSLFYIRIGAMFLRIVSWIFVAQGLIFTCANMFQGLGNTLPALVSSATRLLTYALPAIWISAQPDFHLQDIWYWSITTVLLQAVISLLLLRRQLRVRLAMLAPPTAAREVIAAEA